MKNQQEYTMLQHIEVGIAFILEVILPIIIVPWTMRESLSNHSITKRATLKK